MKIEGICPGYDNVVQSDSEIWKDPVFWTLLQLYRSQLITKSPYEILYKDAPFELNSLAEPIQNIVTTMNVRYKELQKQMDMALEMQDYDNFSRRLFDDLPTNG
jgi:hypothetical protein